MAGTESAGHLPVSPLVRETTACVGVKFSTAHLTVVQSRKADSHLSAILLYDCHDGTGTIS